MNTPSARLEINLCQVSSSVQCGGSVFIFFNLFEGWGRAARSKTPPGEEPPVGSQLYLILVAARSCRRKPSVQRGAAIEILNSALTVRRLTARLLGCVRSPALCGVPVSRESGVVLRCKEKVIVVSIFSAPCAEAPQRAQTA